MTASDTAPRRELTVLGLALGAAITLVFTAANVYLGLKVGLTFASSIPAAVISMAVLRMLRTGTIYENNIVQTVASAAGTLSSVIFVLPGLVMVGWWSRVPLLGSFAICAIGGALGVMYTIPLRRALVTTQICRIRKALPRRRSCASVPVRARRTRKGKPGCWPSSGFGCVRRFRRCRGDASRRWRIRLLFSRRRRRNRNRFRLSLALVGAGHLIGLSVGLAILGGLFISWGISTPILTALHPVAGDAATVAVGVWHTRFA